MAMSDCAKCWLTPCMCGYKYKDWPMSERIKLAASALGIPESDVRQCIVCEPKHLEPMTSTVLRSF